ESSYIAEAAVFERGGRLAAVVVPDDEALKTATTVSLGDLLRIEVARRCADLAPHKRVTGFRVHRRPLPKTRLGKLRRFELDAIYDGADAGMRRPSAEARPEDRALLADPLAERVMARLARRFPDAVLDLDTSPQLDLGVDSLAWLEIAHEVEADLGVSVDDQALAGVVTIRDLLSAVVSAPQGARAADAVARRDIGWRRKRASRIGGALIYGVNRAVMRLFLRVEQEGPLPPDGPAVLFAINHASYIDAFAVAAALPLEIARRTWWSGDATQVYSTPLQRWFAGSVQVFPVDDRLPVESLARAQSVLDDGDHVVWFPEAWRTPDGRLQPFMKGIGVIVNGVRPRICPVYIDGAFDVLPRHRRVPRLGRVRVIFGPTVDADAVAPQGADNPSATADAIRDLVAALEPGGRSK
ncbi:MAG: 1-acyl-sn-glycerol-3-phosphate acyltransferase, partial [Alphaproteobacteria bacterium]|nr:1-acyl-sn-glycerol-3-phosphate acyltransferase [Alphaproteobacteria bacterium]